jgi:hypothetical protein
MSFHPLVSSRCFNIRVRLLALFVLYLNAQTVEAKRFNVADFGAVADSTSDSTAAINQAIDASIAAGTGNEVFIPSGQYRLTKPIEIRNANGLTIHGEPGSTLVVDDADTACVDLNNCKNLTIESLSFDRAHLSFTQGFVGKVDPLGMTCEVTIDPGYADPSESQLAKAELRAFASPKTGTYQLDRYSPDVASWEKMDDRTWRAKLTGHPPTDDWAGKRFFLWAGGRGHCLVGYGLTDCRFENVNYWGGGGNAGLYLAHLFGTITFQHFVIGVPPGSDRILSCAGGGQISDIRGKLVFDNCDFTKIDDDGLDILGNWTRVVEQRDPRTLVVQTDRDFQAGDPIAIWDWLGKMSRSEAVIVKASTNADHSAVLVMDRDVKIERAGVGDGKPFGIAARDDGIDRVIDLDTIGTETEIRNCRFQVFRAKCLNLKANHCTVEGCTFFDSWQPAISAASEWYFEEGPPIRNLEIRNNRFLNCNHSNIEIGAAPGTGYDKVPTAAALSRDSVAIKIEDNYFAGYGAMASVFGYWPIGNAIRVQNARDVIIRHNTFGPPARTAPKSDKILVANSDNVTIEENDGISSVDPEPLPTRSVPVTPAQAKRLEWFRDAKFGMFIHWGLHSVPAATGMEPPITANGP